MVNREAERKRLVEMLRHDCYKEDGELHCASCVYDSEEDCSHHELADYLLANGVFVPPVKVGQIVYFVERNSGKPIGTIDEIEIVMIGKTESGFCARGNLGENTVDIKPPFEIDNYTFFTSREDALKALEGSGESER